ncbi:MAG: DNA polymerase III subunit beta [Odoribacteraceae bacterium]|jgi:DNA polymerase-3 subunit beta|nr:DNA polymerase III subunit beta [Odoribacteraceae bacterium]
MKFVVSSSTFLARLQAVSRVLGGKPTLPILNNILLVASDDVLYVTASDRESTLEARVALESLSVPGSIAVPPKLIDMLKEFPEQPLTFEINDTSLEVKIISDKGVFTMQGENADEFPRPTSLDENVTSLVTRCGTVLDGISRTIFATANDDLRPVMNCVLIEMNADNFTFVASDSHKLVCYKRFDASLEEGGRSLILPKKPAQQLKNLLPREDSELKIEFNDKLARFTFGDYKMLCTLVEGRFPNYQSVIPRENPKKVILEKKELYSSLRRVSVLANQSSNLVRFDLSTGILEVSGQDVDYSTSGHETLSCQYEGEEMTIGFKSSFVLEFLSNLTTDFLVIELADPARPGVFLPFEGEEKDEELLMLLMPMMV